MKRILMFLFIMLLLCSLLSCAKIKNSKIDSNEVSSFNTTNLAVGGNIAMQGDMFLYKKNNTLTTSLVKVSLSTNSKKIIKRFFSTPSEMSFYNDYLFFKQTFAHVATSPLYRIDSDGNNHKKITNKDVCKYLIYEDVIYYTIEETPTDIYGLYKCDLNGKNEKLLINQTVEDFILFENKIIYSAGSSIRCYDIMNDHEKELFSSENRHFCHFELYDECLYFVSYKSTENDNDEYIGSINLNTGEFSVVFNGSCAYQRHIDDNFILFLHNGSYVLLNTADSLIIPVLEEYDINELYKFDDKLFFYALYNGEEALFYTSVANFSGTLKDCTKLL